jgi:hypothetical protein
MKSCAQPLIDPSSTKLRSSMKAEQNNLLRPLMEFLSKLFKGSMKGQAKKMRSTSNFQCQNLEVECIFLRLINFQHI